MNFLLPQATGINGPVQLYQQFLYRELKKLWGLTDQSFNLYGRAVRTQDTDGYTPNVYQGNGNYKELFFDDTVIAHAFFLVDDTTKYADGRSANTQVGIVFCVNLKKLEPNLDMGADEVVRNEVQRLCHREQFGFSMNGWCTGIDNVFKEFSGWRKKEGIKNRDMYPLHCFRINFNLLYNILN